jgi:hypothetical protein
MTSKDLQLVLLDAAMALANPDQPRPEIECADLTLRLLMASKEVGDGTIVESSKPSGA